VRRNTDSQCTGGGALGTLITPWGTGRALLAVAAAVLIVAALNVLLARLHLLSPELID